MEQSIFSQNWFTKQKKEDSGSESERVNSERSVRATRTNITYVASHKLTIRQRSKQYTQFNKDKKTNYSTSDVQKSKRNKKYATKILRAQGRYEQLNVLELFLKSFPGKRAEAKEMNEFIMSDMNMKYFLVNDDLIEFFEKYKKRRIDKVFRNCEKLKKKAD